MTSVAAEFNTAKSTVHDIVKNKVKLQTFLTELQDGDCIKKRRIVRRADLEELDKSSLSLVRSAALQGNSDQRPTADG